MNIKKVTVYAASSDNIANVYLEAAEVLGKMLAENGIDIIYGGGRIGLMGKLADAALSRGGKVIGIIPDFMQDLELGHEEVTELRIVGNMHTRQSMMMKETDFIIALPGGSGTMHELLEAISWKRLNLINIPIIILNINNYFTPLIEMLQRSIEENFMEKEHAQFWNVVESVEEAIILIETI